MLICCQLEISLMNFGNLPQASLEVLLGFVLHPTVLDEGSVVVSTILTGNPTKFVDVAREVERAGGLKFVPKSSLKFRLEFLDPHPINGVLQPSILATFKTSEITTVQTLTIDNALYTVAVVSLDQHDLLRHVFTLFHCAKTENIGCSGICLLVCMGYTHSTSGSDIESGEFTSLIHNRDETNIVGEDVDVIRRRDSDSDFELKVWVRTEE